MRSQAGQSRSHGSTASGGQVFRQRPQFGPEAERLVSILRSHSTSTEHSTAVSTTRGPYSGVSSCRLRPSVPRPASTAACGKRQQRRHVLRRVVVVAPGIDVRRRHDDAPGSPGPRASRRARATFPRASSARARRCNTCGARSSGRMRASPLFSLFASTMTRPPSCSVMSDGRLRIVRIRRMGVHQRAVGDAHQIGAELDGPGLDLGRRERGLEHQAHDRSCSPAVRGRRHRRFGALAAAGA